MNEQEFRRQLNAAYSQEPPLPPEQWAALQMRVDAARRLSTAHRAPIWLPLLLSVASAACAIGAVVYSRQMGEQQTTALSTASSSLSAFELSKDIAQDYDDSVADLTSIFNSLRHF